MSEPGEFEEGELPDAPVAKEHEQESGEASGYDDGEIPPEQGPSSRQAGPPGTTGVDRGLTILSPGLPSPSGPRVVVSPRGVAPTPGAKFRDIIQDEQARAARREESEREELHSLLRELTNYISVSDAMRSLDTVCQDLKRAIKKLDKLFRKVKRKKGDDIEEYPECFAHAKRIHEGLRSVHVVVGTSIGHTHSMESVVNLFRAAMNYRHDVFSAAQKADVEGWVRGSRVLKVIIVEKERERAAKAASAAAGSAAAAPSGGTSGPAGSGDHAKAPTGTLLVSEPQAELEVATRPADTEPPPPPPPCLPPPPLEPYPEPAMSPMSEDADAAGQTPADTGMRGVVPSGSGQTVMRGARGRAAPAFKIVVESTPADIKKAALEQAIAAAAAAAAQAAAAAAATGGHDAGHHGGHTESAGQAAAATTSLHNISGVGEGGIGNKRGSSPEPLSRSTKKARGEDDGGRRDSRRSDRDRRRGSRSRSHSRDYSGRDRDMSPPGRGRYGPPESPMSDDMGPHHAANGYSHLPYGMLPPMYGRDRDGPPPVRDRERERDREMGPPPPGGWTFEERERHRMERERMERMEREGSMDEVGPLLRRGRLVLVVDLDHTLLASARFGELTADTEAQLAARLEGEAASLTDAQRELYRSERLGVWTKLRPGAREFLARADEKFELWAHSEGSRPYAEAMVSLLDPDDRYFGGRLVAAGGGVDGPDGQTMMHNKRLIAALEGRAPLCVALDDASAMWPVGPRLARLGVDRYLFFPSCRRKFGLQGRSLMEINRDECPDRGMMLTLWHLLERLHGLVLIYARHPGPPGTLLSAPPVEPRAPPWDIRNVLADERRKVLQGVCIAFSRVVPQDTDAHAHPLWRLAEAYGAVCEEETSERVTHVVAAGRGTAKTLWAAQNGRPVVTPAWLECCCTLWRKANEERFAAPI